MNWEFVEIYTDEGITATNTKRRDGFNRMVEDALAGKINLIITKSVSRFARNTVDSLTTIRKLKDKGIEVYFEKENIWTLDAKGELLITIMSSLAQEESRSISENTTWGKRKSFADGKASVAYSRFLGYDKDFVINEEEAKIIRFIFKEFLSGTSYSKIAKTLTASAIKTPAGADNWCISTIKSILKNEKYKGDALLQKQYTTDFLTKERKNNSGEIQQYYVEDHHAAIVPPETFDLAQEEIDRRSKARYVNRLFGSKIVCEECGSYFGAKTWHSTSHNRRVVYRCNHKYEDGEKCKTPHLYEEEIKARFCKALGKLIDIKDEVIENLSLLTEIKEPSAVEAEVRALEEDIRGLIKKNANEGMDRQEYERQYETLYSAYTEKTNEYNRLLEAMDKKQSIDKLIETIQSAQAPEFDEKIWNRCVDKMIVKTNGEVVVRFVGGVEV